MQIQTTQRRYQGWTNPVTIVTTVCIADDREQWAANMSFISDPLPQWCAIQHTIEPVPTPEKRRVGVRKGIRP